MATILNEAELGKLIGTVIRDGDPACVRPKSYILRLGPNGEFLNAGKLFTLGDAKKGIRIPPGHSVGLTALETVDFRPTTVQKLYPDCALHAFISPTTDLSREGIVAPTTQVDAGYTGTLNWTITNTSSEERRFIYRERLFRLTVLRLEQGEVPLKYYERDYQDQTGYVRSARKGAPVGMRDSEWEDSVVEGGPEALLDKLMKSGFPWHALGQRLKTIDNQLKIVSDEYAAIDDSLRKLSREFDSLSRQYGDVTKSLPQMIRSTLSEQATGLQNRWLISSASMLLGLLGLIIGVTGSKAASDFLKANCWWIGPVLIVIGVLLMIYIIVRGPKNRA